MTLFNSLWRDPRILPAYVAGASIVVISLQLFLAIVPVKKLFKRDAEGDESVSEDRRVLGAGVAPALRSHVSEHGGFAIYAFKIARFLSILALLVLYAISFLRDEEFVGSKEISAAIKKHKKSHSHRLEQLTRREWVDLILCGTYVSFAFAFLLPN